MDKNHDYTLVEFNGIRYLKFRGVITNISIKRVIGWEDGTWRDYFAVYIREKLGVFRVGTSKTLDGAKNIAINYWEVSTEERTNNA